MDETKLYSWFLGPKAENADLLERLVLEALRDCVFWRRNFHPEDDRRLAAHSVSGKGIQRFFSELGDETVAAPLALVPATAHYSRAFAPFITPTRLPLIRTNSATFRTPAARLFSVAKK